MTQPGKGSYHWTAGRIVARVLLATVALVGAGCGGAAKAGSTPLSAAGQGEATATAAPSYKGPEAEQIETSTIEGASRWLDRSEQDLRVALGPSKGQPGVSSADQARPTEPGMHRETTPVAPSEPPGAAPTEGAQPQGVDRCSIACEALTSMKNAASRLCGLAGEADARCVRAGERVAQAQELVRAACPACAAASAGPP